MRAALLLLVACTSSGTSSQPAPPPQPLPPMPADAVVSPEPAAVDAMVIDAPPPTPDAAKPAPPDAAAKPAKGPGIAENCGPGDSCATGLECVAYYGIAGPRGPQFKTCEKRCSKGTKCPTGTSCVTVADGPGQVCR